MCCRVLKCTALCCSVVQCVAVCCSVLQYATVSYSVLQCVGLQSRSKELDTGGLAPRKQTQEQLNGFQNDTSRGGFIRDGTRIKKTKLTRNVTSVFPLSLAQAKACRG